MRAQAIDWPLVLARVRINPQEGAAEGGLPVEPLLRLVGVAQGSNSAGQKRKTRQALA